MPEHLSLSIILQKNEISVPSYNQYLLYLHNLINQQQSVSLFSVLSTILIYDKFFSYISSKYLISHFQVSVPLFFLCNIKYSLVIFRHKHITFLFAFSFLLEMSSSI